ncbi:hypothetical protein BABINDRAFT_166365 [Babjeviella inositovora NRRL Y-12698]|uniref:Uncharacterized protein n=1 Tax=Babjeviella inositovora NRRL Y-12698 TaxID=984486 RepID=A0A1E3QSU3_9ASCO|nr:uncharacterized protein BABINDRAFT_166365 [Babjeviella inositovora NRRL Y-12698]ODQ80783.1 hypothetical protein BABINDRAFT_166365 [Babjeviella inositovora NRRL Y-12698]
MLSPPSTPETRKQDSFATPAPVAAVVASISHKLQLQTPYTLGNDELRSDTSVDTPIGISSDSAFADGLAQLLAKLQPATADVHEDTHPAPEVDFNAHRADILKCLTNINHVVTHHKFHNNLLSFENRNLVARHGIEIELLSREVCILKLLLQQKTRMPSWIAHTSDFPSHGSSYYETHTEIIDGTPEEAPRLQAALEVTPEQPRKRKLQPAFKPHSRTRPVKTSPLSEKTSLDRSQLPPTAMFSTTTALCTLTPERPIGVLSLVRPACSLAGGVGDISQEKQTRVFYLHNLSEKRKPVKAEKLLPRIKK